MSKNNNEKWWKKAVVYQIYPLGLCGVLNEERAFRILTETALAIYRGLSKDLIILRRLASMQSGYRRYSNHRRRTTVMTFQITGILTRRLAVSMIWRSS